MFEGLVPSLCEICILNSLEWKVINTDMFTNIYTIKCYLILRFFIKLWKLLDLLTQLGVFVLSVMANALWPKPFFFRLIRAKITNTNYIIDHNLASWPCHVSPALIIGGFKLLASYNLSLCVHAWRHHRFAVARSAPNQVYYTRSASASLYMRARVCVCVEYVCVLFSAIRVSKTGQRWWRCNSRHLSSVISCPRHFNHRPFVNPIITIQNICIPSQPCLGQLHG